MAAATAEILREQKNDPPRVGTFPIAASTRILKGAFVAINASGYALMATEGDGFKVVGISHETYDNSAGAAGDLDAQVKYGVISSAYDSAPKTGDRVFAVDNQTVSANALSSTGARRSPVGIVTEVRNAKAYVRVGPEAMVTAGASGLKRVNVPLGALRLSTGAAIPAFGAGTADGFELTDSEALGLRINDDSTTVFAGTFPLPADLDDAQDVTLRVMGFRVGSADVTAALTVGAFFHTVGAAHTADANAGGDTSAFDQATTIVSEATLAIAAADVPAAPCDLTLTFVATAALDADDLVITSAWLEYKSK
jgi:hypothetical protein